jgi:signal transduction histidine kinase
MKFGAPRAARRTITLAATALPPTPAHHRAPARLTASEAANAVAAAEERARTGVDAAEHRARTDIASAEERARLAIAAAEERAQTAIAAADERGRTAITAADLRAQTAITAADLRAQTVTLAAEERAQTATRAAEERARRAADGAAEAWERALRAEERLRTREAELAGFATSAVDNLHAPLHTIASFTELLLEDVAPGLDAEVGGHLDVIGGAVRRMLVAVNELAAYATAGGAPLRLEPVEASMLALDVIADRLQGQSDGPEVEIGELPAVTADALLLRQVLDHLVGNAVRFVPPGTRARVTVDAREQDGGWWRIEVADRGIGVPAEQRERIFAPFHKAAKGYPGAGLGLAVCARIVARHGGEIGAEANPGGGSVFWFTLAGAGISARQRALS